MMGCALLRGADGVLLVAGDGALADPVADDAACCGGGGTPVGPWEFVRAGSCGPDDPRTVPVVEPGQPVLQRVRVSGSIGFFSSFRSRDIFRDGLTWVCGPLRPPVVFADIREDYTNEAGYELTARQVTFVGGVRTSEAPWFPSVGLAEALIQQRLGTGLLSVQAVVEPALIRVATPAAPWDISVIPYTFRTTAFQPANGGGVSVRRDLIGGSVASATVPVSTGNPDCFETVIESRPADCAPGPGEPAPLQSVFREGNFVTNGPRSTRKRVGSITDSVLDQPAPPCSSCVIPERNISANEATGDVSVTAYPVVGFLAPQAVALLPTAAQLAAGLYG